MDPSHSFSDLGTRHSNQLLLTDSSTLWSAEGVARKYPDSRGLECLTKLVDMSIDPRRTLRCLFQQPGLDDQAQKVPWIYLLFKKNDLMRPETKVTAKEYEGVLTDDVLLDLLDLMHRWCAANPKYATEFKDLHRHPNVYDLDRYRALSQDGRADAVPPRIYEFCRERAISQITGISRTVNWTVDDVMFVFTIIARGLQYECAAHLGYGREAHYMMHPVRSLAMCRDFQITYDFPRKLMVGLGGKIVRAWQDKGSNDLPLLVDWILTVRSKAHNHLAFLDGQITDQQSVVEHLHDLLSSIPPVPKKLIIEHAGSYLGAAVGGAIGALGGLVTAAFGAVLGTWVTYFINPGWANKIRIPMPQAVANLPLLRACFEYPDAVITSSRICIRCNTDSLLSPCPVCNYNKGSGPAS